jgi:hypothetical protein
MEKIWMRAGALGIAVGALGLLMVQAGLSSCGSTTPEAEPTGSPAAPPITTKASESPSTEEPAAETPPRYMPATKAGPMIHRPNAPPQQQAAPNAKGE